MRQLAQPATSNAVTAFLIDEPIVCEVAQYGSVFANHRLKSFWLLHSPNLRLTATNLIHGVYAQGTLEYVENGSWQTLRLQRRNDDVSSSVLQERAFVKTNVVTIQTTYYWPKTSAERFGLFTPLQRFVQTRIAGLTTSPILLTNHYSQSYGAYAHNAMEEFLFEPRLEPGLPPATLAELEAANIQLIYVSAWGVRASAFYVIGFDQTLRRL